MASLSLSLSLSKIIRASDQKGKSSVFCKKHPKHHQSPGVCSLCLNERLSQFIKSASSSSSASQQRRRKHILCSSSSSLSSYYSSSVSSCPSPLDSRYKAKGFSWMTKSRSVAYNASDDKMKDKKTKGRFFLSLVGPRRDNKRA